MSKQVTLACSYHWWQGDDLPRLSPLPGFSARVVDDRRLLASLHELAEEEIQARFEEGAYCYVAFLEDEPVGYGWVGTKIGHVREAGLEWTLGEQDRALWDFSTLPVYRGRSVYPHLLQAILRSESAHAERFWIGHQGQNFASQRGIEKAGFTLHHLMVLTPDGRIAHELQGDLTRAAADPMLPVAQALTEKIPEAARQRLLQTFSHLF